MSGGCDHVVGSRWWGENFTASQLANDYASGSPHENNEMYDYCPLCGAPLRGETPSHIEQLEAAWGVIANAYGGNWDHAECSVQWKSAAIKWRDEVWHPALEARAVDFDTSPDLLPVRGPGL